MIPCWGNLGTSSVLNFGKTFTPSKLDLASPDSTTIEPQHPLSSPNFIVTNGGDVIPVQEGGIGPYPADSGKGFKFIGGSDGKGLSNIVNGVRIMDPTSRYPTGYASFNNQKTEALKQLIHILDNL